METQPHMVYGPRPVHPAHPASVPVYMAHYSSASGQPLAHPQYQLPSPCVPYPSPSHMAAAQVHFHHRYDAPAMAQDDNSHRSLHNEDGKQCFEDFSFPMSPASSVVSVPDQSLKAKTIVANMPKDSKDVVQFNTNVDQLMKTIQADEENMEDQQQLCTPAPSPRSELESGRSTPAMPVASSSGNARVKKYVCQGPNCNKKFSQKTHLEIHSRTHSGLKPYVSSYISCPVHSATLSDLIVSRASSKAATAHSLNVGTGRRTCADTLATNHLSARFVASALPREAM